MLLSFWFFLLLVKIDQRSWCTPVHSLAKWKLLVIHELVCSSNLSISPKGQIWISICFWMLFSFCNSLLSLPPFPPVDILLDAAFPSPFWISTFLRLMFWALTFSYGPVLSAKAICLMLRTHPRTPKKKHLRHILSISIWKFVCPLHQRLEDFLAFIQLKNA